MPTSSSAPAARGWSRAPGRSPPPSSAPPTTRSESLVARGAHPDVVEFEPTTATYTLANEIRAPRAGRPPAATRVAARHPRDPQGADRGRPQGRHGPRRRPDGGGRRQHAAQEHRGAAAPHGDPAAHRPSRRAARDDPVAVPARRLRVRATGALGGDRRGARHVRGASCHGSTAGAPPRSSSSRSSRPRSTRRVHLRGGRGRRSSRSSTPTSSSVAIRRARRPRCAGGSASGSARSCAAPRPMRSSRASSAIEQAYLDVLADAPARCGRSGPGVRRARRLPRRPPGRRVQPERGLAVAAPGVAAAARRLTRQEVRIGGGAFGTLPDPAGIAQSAEQLTRNEQVKGSNPFPGSTRVSPRRRFGPSVRASIRAA